VIDRIRDQVDNLAGLKVSESPFERVAPYLELGLPVLIGNEPLVPQGLAQGAVGSVSGMAAALPDVVRAALDDPSDANAARLRDVRAAMEASGPFIAAAKHVLGTRVVQVRPDVRAPLRPLMDAERRALVAALGPLVTAPSAA
jgi:dihydrodipicolinate synthase/N-acetylneuraminate lyase